jgi:ankyrin repeat protein
MSELIDAINNRASFEDLQALMTEKHLLEERDTQGRLPIHHAVAVGNMALVTEMLFQNPRLVNAEDNNHTTPLIIATQQGNIQMLELLLQVEGVNPNIQELTAHHTAMHYAAGAVNFAAAEKLFNAGALLNAVTISGLHIMHLIASAIVDGEKKGWDLLKWFHSKGADVAPESNTGETPESILNGADQSYGEYYNDIMHEK